MEGETLRETFETTPHELLAAVAAEIRGLEAHADSPAALRVRSLIDNGGELFVESARPRGLFQRISVSDFEEIYHRDGQNDDDTPLEQVIEDAKELALFAVTLGEEVSRQIDDFFAAANPADGYILDQIASFAADELAAMAAQRFRKAGGAADLSVLPYSPGYCGWNVSGQRALFAELKPTELGITINDSCLMHPTKSVSGVLVVAPLEAHDFSPAFPCCTTCTTLACQDRVTGLKDRSQSG
jgi:hypothetical protein